MARFRFRFQKILNYKQQVEDERQVVFIEAQRQYREAQEELKRLKTKYQQYLVELAGKQASTITIEELRLYQVYASQLRGGVEWQQSEVAKYALAVEAKRTELQLAVQERKMTERLRVRHAEAHRQETEQAEQKLMDEMARIAVGQFVG